IVIIGASDFIPNYGIEYYPIGFIFVTVGLGIITYAIIKHRLLNINIAITRAGIFAFVYTAVLAIPFIIGGIIKPYLFSIMTNWWIIPVLIGVILASAGPFIYMRLQRKFEARLRAYEFKSHEALRRLSHNMLRFTNLNVLLRLMVHYLVKVLKLRFAAIYLFDRQSEKYLLSSAWQSSEDIELPEEFEANSYLAEYLDLKKLPVIAEELSLYAPTAATPKVKKLFSDLSAFKINTVIPSFLRNALLGFLILSDRKGNIPFTQEDLNLLMVLSNEAALAIENAQFHQKEISQLVEKSKREALADMAPGASHQFNNRLASISSSVELLLFKMESFNIEAHQDEKTKAFLKDAKEALELIDNEVYKGKEITSAILKRAKAKVEFQEFNLPTLIENTYKLVMISRSRSGLDRAKELKFNIACSDKIPDIFASEALLQDVFYNLIDNAYDAIQDKAKIMSQEGNPLFQGEIEVALSREDNIIVAKVRDNGIGLTKENHRKLFTPYFTTKATSNKGSGLGLCVIRDFIETHKGTIACDSEYNKGAAFTIRLPIKKEKAHGN
ncbi:MAG: GAF domain-containing protein, partial [Candidatus Omnitrophica bacterium]|nr:GAF domain-containing protein [Candidatus Omnitrophota bacterium]